jgi:TRAP-type C4-dicarboxylate transport system substrate-binding protein
MIRLLPVFLVIFGLGIGEALAQKTILRVGSFTPPRSIAVKYALQPFVERLNKTIGDEVTAEGYWGGSLGRNPRKYVDLVKDGVVDIAMVVPGYTPGQFPGFSVFELPFIAQTGLEGSLGEWRTYNEGLFTGWDDFKVVSLFSTDPNHIHTKRPIKSITDLDGMKIRIAGPVYGWTVKHYGGVPIGIPVTQATEALSRGVVDGILLGYSGAGVFRVFSIAKYTYAAPLGISPLAIAMNKQKWNALSARAKAAIDEFGGETMSRDGGIGFDRVGKLFRAKAVKAGHNIIDASAADIDKGFRFVQPVHKAWIEKNKNGRQIYDTYMKAVADIRAGR